MFYIKELYFRIIFIIFVISTLFFTFYNYKYIILLIFLIPNQMFGNCLIRDFIYTNPTELLLALIDLSIFFTVLFSIPYMIWMLLDFTKTGLYNNEYKKIKIYFNKIIIIIILLNVILFFLLLPTVLKFFQSFNSFQTENINITLELKICEFVNFVYSIFYIINIGLILILILIGIITINGITFYIKYKKIFLTINIITATILSPPDISSQIILFMILNFFLESFQLIISYKIKTNKVTY